MIYLNNTTILLEWDDKEKWIKFVLRGFIDGREYRAALNAGIDAMIAHGATKVLWDLRKMRVVTLDDQTWAETDWVPRMIKTTKVRFTARVQPQSPSAQEAVSRINSRTTQVVANGITQGRFTSLEEAMSWLRSVG